MGDMQQVSDQELFRATGLLCFGRLDRVLIISLLVAVNRNAVTYQMRRCNGFHGVFVLWIESGLCMRQCCGNNRGFIMHIADNMSQVVHNLLYSFLKMNWTIRWSLKVAVYFWQELQKTVAENVNVNVNVQYLSTRKSCNKDLRRLRHEGCLQRTTELCWF